MGYEAIPVQSQPEDLFCNRGMVRLSGICLCQIDPLPRPKNNALSGLEIGRYVEPGQVVELEVEKIGVLRNRIVRG